MKKFLTIATTALLLFSCNNDNNAESMIQGSWILEKYGTVVYTDGEAYPEYYSMINNFSAPYTFNNNNKVKIGEYEVGTYTSNTFTIQNEKFHITTLNSNTLIGKKHPNGMQNGTSQNIYFKR